jgi:predicted regulator of amino acid metabolism with ACT domain
LKDYPARLAVVKLLIEHGINVKDGKTYCGKIEISFRALSQAAQVDQRTVNRTIRTIEEKPQLLTFFRNIKPAGPSILDVAKFLGFGVVEITPTNAKKYGILAASASLLASKKICIRQALVDDPELTPEPKLTLIIEKKTH